VLPATIKVPSPKRSIRGLGIPVPRSLRGSRTAIQQMVVSRDVIVVDLLRRTGQTVYLLRERKRRSECEVGFFFLSELLVPSKNLAQTSKFSRSDELPVCT
jgi:hypothetical protein